MLAGGIGAIRAYPQVSFSSISDDPGILKSRSSMAVSSPEHHIDEIDGLRAVAVLSVLLYHLGIRSVSGGYVGVDVFFAISGYLITGILLKNPGDHESSLRRFYARRILRIAPALFVTLASTALIFYVLVPPALSAQLLASLASAVFSYSNLWFYFTIDYFANGATNPVLHTWSLAVEEQFYFFFPLLLLLIGKFGKARYTSAVLACLFVLSLFASGIVVAESQSKAFYFPWLRAWELLAGSLLAAFRPELVAARFKAPLSNAGLAAIVASCILYDDKTVFPGYPALLPVLGAIAVIAGAGSASIANLILRAGFMRWTGRISYSLYLVHWPIVCAASMLVSLNSGKIRTAIVLASFLFAWISWRFVEIPFRRMAGRVPERNVFAAFAGACVAAVPYFFILRLASAALWNQFPNALEYSRFVKTDTSYFHAGTCFLTDKFDALKYFDFANCLDTNQPRRSVIVIGDSHAANIVDALAARHASLNVLQATAAGCKPVLNATGPAYCTDLMKRVYEEWLPKSGPEVAYVVIAARWTDEDIEPLKRTISSLKQLDKRIILYGPTPDYYLAVPLILAYQDVLGVNLESRMLNRERRELDAKFRSSFSGEVAYFSPLDKLCNLKTCVLAEESSPLYFDRDHLTPSGVTRAIEGFPLP